MTLSFAAGELEDGVYRIEVLQTAQDNAGNSLDGDGNGTGGDNYLLQGDANNKFYQLEAEWNGDEGVSVFDFSTFSYWFGFSTLIAPKYVDLNDDDGVSVFDFSGFSANFGEGIVYQVGFVGALAIPREAVVPSDQRLDAIEQIVEIPDADTDWELVAIRPKSEETGTAQA